MPNPASVDDVVLRYRPVSGDEETRVQALLDDAWAMLLAPTRLPTLDADLMALRVSEANVIRVVCAMVIRVARRVLTNPEGYAEESLGEYRYRLDEALASGVLEPTAQELLDLTAGVPRRRVRSTRLVAYGES